MKFKKNVCVTMLLIGALLCVTSCGKREADPAEFNVAMMREALYASQIHIVMKEEQLIEKYVPEDVSVNWSIIASNDEQRDSLSTGDLDSATMATTSFIAAYENGLDMVPLASFNEFEDSESILLYSCRDDIKSMDDLTMEDRIAIVGTIGGATHMAFMMACEERFGDALYFEANTVTMSYSDVLAVASTSDELAATVIAFTPGVSVLPESGLTHIENITRDALTISVMKRDFYESNPELAEAYRKAFIEASEFIVEHPEDAAVHLASYWEGCTVEQIVEYLKTRPHTYKISETSYDATAQFMYRNGMIDHEPSPFSAFANYDSIPKVD